MVMMRQQHFDTARGCRNRIGIIPRPRRQWTIGAGLHKNIEHQFQWQVSCRHVGPSQLFV